MIPGQGAVVARVRSTKAGALTPATPRRLPSTRRPCRTLNEGRGSHPGDTTSYRNNSQNQIDAQRRPGLSPRRHPGKPSGSGTPNTSAQRSPGSHPGDTASRTSTAGPRRGAQRRPGSHPGDTQPRCRLLRGQLARSTKAGALTPATPDDVGEVGRLVGALNEGRGSHPGDTRSSSFFIASTPPRSTKAGALTPATREGPAQ